MDARLILALTALVGAAAADPVREPVAPAFPARAAAPLVYAYVPGPVGAATWGELQIEGVRLGMDNLPADDATGTGISPLFFMDRTPMPEERAAQRPEPRREAPALPEPSPPPADRAAEVRMLGALEAMGLKPEDLVEKPEMPAAALALADAITRLDALLAVRRPREKGSGSAPIRLDPEERRARRPAYVRHGKPIEEPEPTVERLTLYAKKVTRSLYKVILGIAIGILIWGFVRDTG